VACHKVGRPPLLYLIKITRRDDLVRGSLDASSFKILSFSFAVLHHAPAEDALGFLTFLYTENEK
jgi:hypothetical protein